QTDDIRVRPLDAGDEARGQPLNRVRPGFVESFPTRHIPRDLVGPERRKVDHRRLDTAHFVVAHPQANAGHHFVATARQPGQHRRGLAVVTRLCDDFAVDDDGRVRAKHDDLFLTLLYVVAGFRLRVKLRRTAGVPNAAPALGWPAV